VNNCYSPLEKGLSCSIVLSTRRELHHHSSIMTSSFREDQLAWTIAHFLCDAKRGDILSLPGASLLTKAPDGSFSLARSTFMASRLIDPTSDKIAATVLRWEREGAQEAA
jgi:hypothetical protein